LATQFGVDLVFRSQTQQLDQVVNKINKFERDLARLKGADPFQGVEDSARGAGNATEKAGRQAQNAAGGFRQLRGAIAELATGLAVMQGIKFIFGKTAELETQTKSIESLVGSLQKARSIVGELQQYANVTPFTSSEIIDTAKRLSAFGVSAEKVVDTTKRLGDVAGVTGANLGELSLAYGQVMAKGRLSGEELLQFQERGVALQGELRKMYKMNGEQFADALSKGKISAEAVEVALLRLTSTGGKYANGAISQSNTLNGKLSTLQDSIANLGRTIGRVFEPLFKWLLDQATQIISTITDAIDLAAQGPQKAKVLSDIRSGKLPGNSLNPIDLITGNTSPNKLYEILGKGDKGAGEAIFKDLARKSRTGNGYLPNQDKLVKLLQQHPTIRASGASNKPLPNLTPPPLADGNGGGGGGRRKAPTGRIIEYLTGDKSSSGYRADHGGANYHEHLAFQTAQQMQLAMKALQAAGIKVGSTTGGRHAPGSYHYSGQALDVPASQVPVGQEQMLSKMVRQVLAKAGFVGQGIGGEGGNAIDEVMADYRDKLADSFTNGAKLTVEMQRQLQLLGASDEKARRLLEIENAYEDRKAQINELLDAGQRAQLDELNNKIRTTDLLREEISLLYEKAGLTSQQSNPYTYGQASGGAFRTDVNLDPNAKQGKLATYMTELKTQLGDTEGTIVSLAQTVEGELGGAMSNAVMGLINGTQTAEQAFRQMFSNIAASFIQMATQMIAKAMIMKVLGILGGGSSTSLFSGAGPFQMPGGNGFNGFNLPNLLPGRASGGPVTGGSPYIVGERGPELFVPGTSGGIVPNHALGGSTNVSIVVNADGGGASATASGTNKEEALKLARMMESAALSVINRERRPGGVLSR
jgi:hypothetical protein